MRVGNAHLVNNKRLLTGFQDLLQINCLFCGFTPIFLRRVMSEDFQRRFLGIRESLLLRHLYSTSPLPSGRYWLERLVRSLTYVSPFEQNVSLLKRLRLAVQQSDDYAAIRSALENRLYYQLREEFGNWGFSFIIDRITASMSLGAYQRSTTRRT